jgi:predicted transcriptional regulator
MSLVSIRLPEDIEARLAREAARTQRPKSEIARDAIVDYLARMERERFLDDIARAARERDHGEALAVAAEALVTDNEALDASERPAVQDPKPRYGGTRRRKTRR